MPELGDPIQDYIILAVPPEVDLSDPGVAERLRDKAEAQIIHQYRRPPKALVIDAIDWLITNDWREVEINQPAHDCPTCRAGNDQAVAFLKEHPDRQLALGNLRYWEVW